MLTNCSLVDCPFYFPYPLAHSKSRLSYSIQALGRSVASSNTYDFTGGQDQRRGQLLRLSRSYYKTKIRLLFPVERFELRVFINMRRRTYNVKCIGEGQIGTGMSTQQQSKTPREDKHIRINIFSTSPLFITDPSVVPTRIIINLNNNIMFNIFRSSGTRQGRLSVADPKVLDLLQR